MADTTGEADLRAEAISKLVKGFALENYVMKQLCMIENSTAWTETYYKETAADLTGGTGSAIKGVPRLANFPYAEVSWTKTSARNVKHAVEGVISWEDIKTNNIPMIQRTLLRLSRAITKSVDDEISAVIVSGAGNTTAGTDWNDAVIADRDPVQDLLRAKSLISIDNYNPDRNGYLLVHPTNYAELLGNASVRNAGQFWTDSATKNGRVGMIAGLTVLVSNSVTLGGAQVVIAKEAMTWKSVQGLKIETINDPGIKTTVRAWEVGQIQVVNEDAICTITAI